MRKIPNPDFYVDSSEGYRGPTLHTDESAYEKFLETLGPPLARTKVIVDKIEQMPTPE